MKSTLAVSCMAVLAWSNCGDNTTAGPTQPVVGEESPGTVTEALSTELTFVDTMLSAAVAGVVGTTPPDSVRSLSLVNREITDVTGIGQFRQLHIFDLSDNAIVDVSPLSELDSLVFLNLTANQIEDVSPLGSLANLEFLLTGGESHLRPCTLARFEAIEVAVLAGQPSQPRTGHSPFRLLRGRCATRPRGPGGTG